MEEYTKKVFNLGRKAMCLVVQTKLLKRANYYLEKAKNKDSSNLILMASELRIQADEIKELLLEQSK